MRVGDLIFVKNKGIFFKKIRQILSSEYDHIAIVVSETKIVEALPFGGVCLKEISKYDNEECAYTRIRESLYVPKIVECCVDKVGLKYDFLQVLGIYFLILFKIKKTVDPIDIQKAYICTELIGQAADHAGLIFSEGVAVDRLLPDDILNSDKVMRLGGKNA